MIVKGYEFELYKNKPCKLLDIKYITRDKSGDLMSIGGENP